jgi:hypothetical protein
MASVLGSTRDEIHQSNNVLEFPSLEGSEGLKALTQQLLTWKPDTKGKTDCVMALWFAIIRVRELMQQSSQSSKFAYNRWATKSQTNSRITINLDEAFADQWNEIYG